MSSSRHQTAPSIGPAFTEPRSAGGISDSIDCRRATESRFNSSRRPSVGESCEACSSVTGWFRRIMKTVVERSFLCN